MPKIVMQLVKPTKVWALIDDTGGENLLTGVAVSPDAAVEWEASGDEHIALACWIVPAPDEHQSFNLIVASDEVES